MKSFTPDFNAPFDSLNAEEIALRGQSDGKAHTILPHTLGLVGTTPAHHPIWRSFHDYTTRIVTRGRRDNAQR